MIPTHFLFQLAEHEGIAVEWHDFTNIKGLYVFTPSIVVPVIALSNSLRTRERKLRCVFSRELGHHFATAGNHLIAAKRTDSIWGTKCELLATKWALNLMINTERFIECIRNGMSKREIVDYFYVSNEFVDLKGKMLKESGEYADVVSEPQANRF